MRDQAPPPLRTHALRSTAVAAAAGVLLSGCGAATTATGRAATAPATTARCEALPPGHLPHAAGALTQQDTGTYCLRIGGQVDVFLSVPPAQARSGTRWSPVAVTSAKVLTRMNSGILTPPVGVTPAILLGSAPSTDTLTSHLPDGRSWHATIVVR